MEHEKILLINKPLYWTSFDVIKKIRRITKIKKVGHAGTLDPLATGLLIVCTGRYTKKISEYMAQEKEYCGTFVLGATTPSYDLESKPENSRSTLEITEQYIQSASLQFLGEQLQVPPAHSAIKINGTRVYELARKGKEVRIEPRKIHIREFEISKIEIPVVHFRVVCSTGTYIRSLANDFGRALGCGAYLGSLCRTRIGASQLADSMTIEQFEQSWKD